jgi:deferrochelatase/peroxidase EfeB
MQSSSLPPAAVAGRSHPPIRETPAPEPLHGAFTDPSHPPVPDEPVLDVDNIQGNVIPGFSKDHQLFLFYTLDDVAAFRGWLSAFVPFVASAAEVLAFNRLFKAIRRRHGEPADRPQTVKATWRNIAFSYTGLTKLRDCGLDDLLDPDFEDEAFREDLASRAERLGDPVDSGQDGDPLNWRFGGPTNPVDLVVHIASDDPDDLDLEAQWIQANITGVTLAWKQRGENLPKDVSGRGDLSGHEHFGFLDGVSQPGLRGRISEQERDVLTPRQNPNNRGQGKPGQDLLWPGEFVFGYPTQVADAISIAEPGPLSHAGPEWARNGSFLVFRRLKQDVFLFHNFLKTQAPGGLTPDLFGAKLVGRWASGAPVLRTPAGIDNPDLGNNDCNNNNFEFQEETAPIPASGLLNSFDCEDHRFTQSQGDKNGLLCPFAGHIRKAYPRDDVARGLDVCDNEEEEEAPEPCGALSREPAAKDAADTPVRPVPNEKDTQTHRLLRRGVPFGQVSLSTFASPRRDDPPDGRGLLFLAFQTSIKDQFEFVTQCWVNNPDFKDAGSGHDLIIGQNAADPTRTRTLTVKVGEDAEDCVEVSTTDEWVIPTGGGYFFAPSIEALRELLSE